MLLPDGMTVPGFGRTVHALDIATSHTIKPVCHVMQCAWCVGDFGGLVDAFPGFDAVARQPKVLFDLQRSARKALAH